MAPALATPGPARAILLFPGWGGTGAELRQTVSAWAQRWPGVELIGLDPPHPCDAGPSGRQWFSRIDINAANRVERVRGARSGFDAVLGDALAKAGLDASDTLWVGYSQGAMVVLDALARGCAAPRAAVAIAGRLIAPPTAPATTDVLLLHGERDDVVPVSASREAHRVLADHGYAASLVTMTRVGHQLTRDLLERAASFLDPYVRP